MKKKEIMNINQLLKSLNDLKEVFGEDITLCQIEEKLKLEENNEENTTLLKYDDLRDYLITKLIKTLIKRDVIDAVSPITLKVLNRADLKDILEKYFDGINHIDINCSRSEQFTGYLFYPCGGDAFNYLQECIKNSIEKWGLDKNINDFTNNHKDLSVSKVKCKCDYDENISIIELLEDKHGEDNLLEYMSVKDMYDMMLKVRNTDVERTGFTSTELEFFLLVWKYYSLEIS